MNSLNDAEWAVVAGASGAIGKNVVERMVSRDLQVVAVARTAEGLEALAAAHDAVHPCVADITSDQSVALIRDALPGTCRAVINAAAAPLGGHVDDVSSEAVLAAVDVKINGTLRLVRAVDSRLVKDSRVIVLGGNLGYDPIPEAAYGGALPSSRLASAPCLEQIRDLAVTVECRYDKDASAGLRLHFKASPTYPGLLRTPVVAKHQVPGQESRERPDLRAYVPSLPTVNLS